VAGVRPGWCWVNLETIPVPGADDLLATQSDGRQWVALKPMCETLGIDPWSQLLKLKGKSWATTRMTPVVAADGKVRKMAMIDSKTIPMWLATIDEDRVSPEARPKLIAYQREARDALDAYFNRRVSSPPPMNQLDVLRAALDQIEAVQRDADKANARLDGIEGRHDWFSALGYARLTGAENTSNAAMQRLGKRRQQSPGRPGSSPSGCPTSTTATSTCCRGGSGERHPMPDQPPLSQNDRDALEDNGIADVLEFESAAGDLGALTCEEPTPT
jgi:P22_AR N-terminal domain